MAELILLLLAGTAFVAGRLGWEPGIPGSEPRVTAGCARSARAGDLVSQR
jgi:hypothetical protein